MRVEQPGPVEVADERGEGLVERRQLAAHARRVMFVVHVPAAVGQRDEAHARLDQPPGQEHALAGGVAAVLVAQGAGSAAMLKASRAWAELMRL